MESSAETRYLIALTLQESVSLKIYRERRSLFRERGWTSALALPPLIPLGWYKKRPIEDEVPYLSPPDRPLETGRTAAIHRGNLFLPCTSEIFKSRYSLSGDAEGWFAPYQGIFLSAEESSCDQLPEMQPGTIGDIRLACFSLTSKTSETQWWKDLLQELLWSKHIR